MNRSSSSGRGWFDQLISLLALIAGLMLAGLTLLICLDVFVRFFRLFAMPWTLDVAEYLLYAITFLGAPWVLRDNAHIAIDFVVENLPSKQRRRVTLLANLIGTAACAVLFFYAARTWWRSFSEKIMVHETFIFPEWYLFSVAPPIFLILAVMFGRMALRPDAAITAEKSSQPEGF